MDGKHTLFVPLEMFLSLSRGTGRDGGAGCYFFTQNTGGTRGVRCTPAMSISSVTSNCHRKCATSPSWASNEKFTAKSAQCSKETRLMRTLGKCAACKLLPKYRRCHPSHHDPTLVKQISDNMLDIPLYRAPCSSEEEAKGV